MPKSCQCDRREPKFKAKADLGRPAIQPCGLTTCYSSAPLPWAKCVPGLDLNSASTSGLQRHFSLATEGVFADAGNALLWKIPFQIWTGLHRNTCSGIYRTCLCFNTTSWLKALDWIWEGSRSGRAAKHWWAGSQVCWGPAIKEN